MEKYQFSQEQRTLLEGMQIPFAVFQTVNRRIVTLVLSDGFCKLFGYTDRAQAYYDMDNNMYKDTHPDDVARIANAASRFASEGGSYEVVYRTRKRFENAYTVVHAVGEHVWLDGDVRVAQVWYTDEGTFADTDTAGEPEFVKAMRSVLHEQSILKGNQYDFLTGLPNMAHFFELAEYARDAILAKNGQPALLYMDFIGMKFFNSKHGFAQGDQILKVFAKILSAEFGSEVCCRIGADHFAVVAEEEGLEEKLQRIFQTYAAAYEGRTPPVCVGIYPHRMGTVSVSVACDRAKLACRSASVSYESGFSYYTDKLLEDALLRQYVIETLDTALREKWIRVYYQPIVRSVNERICNAEALARWDDPVKGFMSPASFIPALEEAGLIYRLDLYILDRVLEDIRTLQAKGLDVVSYSINLSRSDFGACDIVEEIRKRVDAAGVSRDRITVEITESVIGSNFEFMRDQIARFKDLGFPVWMDDFGSGYSSLDLLQSVRFDLMKFDLSFMLKLDEGENGRIILTELMKMASALGVETICEGVETIEQARFLQKIGCSKLQGFHYGKPSPFAQALEWYADGRALSTENPDEAGYYESIGRVNLYDLSVIAQDEESSFQNTFNTLPMGIIEIRDNCTRFTRSNQSYRDFVKRFFGFDLSVMGSDFTEFDAPFLQNIVKTCCEQGQRLFYDEKMPDGSLVHSFARRICTNPVSGSVAIAIAVLSVREPDERETYADIARALAADYYNIYVVDLETDRYIEYSSPIGEEDLAVERHGSDFFEAAKHDTMVRLYEDDRDLFLSWFSKENIIRTLDAQGAFTTTYRLTNSGRPMYVNMKVTRMRQSSNRIILGISIVDAYMRQKEHFEALLKERDAMARVMALSDGYLSMYTVDLDTDNYVVYSSTDVFDTLGASKQGEDFFRQSAIDAEKYFHPDDLQRFTEQFTKENVLREIRAHGRFIIQYRLMIQGEAKQVTLKAGLFREGDEEKMVVGVRA